MKRLLICLTLFVLPTCFSGSLKAQYSPSEPVPYRPQPPAPPTDFGAKPADKNPPARINLARAKLHAQQLEELAKQISEEVNALSSDKLAKDLPRNLKQVQKLAKTLRSDITPAERLTVPEISRVDDH